VLSNWSEIKRSERGGELFGELPEILPATLYAKKLQTRAARAGLRGDEPAPGGGDRESFERVGDVLFDAVDNARRLGVDPELALRAAATRFREDIEETAG
jgi:uncharacterized protein YabN with tetrapyrrole methylase and pyrophosphatase domain